MQQSVSVGAWELRTEARSGFGMVVTGVLGATDSKPTTYLDPILADAEGREAFFSLVDTAGVVVCRNLEIDPSPYRRVGGRRTQGKLSQGEYFHHDGCSTPTKPRVVEIRCPGQDWVRTMGTAIAPYEAAVHAMLLELPVGLTRVEGLRAWRELVASEAPLTDELDHVQGVLNRAIRSLAPEDARVFFRDVDARVGAFVEPWTLRESRFIANCNSGSTAQHRRACYPPWMPGTPNGHLLKRWPAEELPAL